MREIGKPSEIELLREEVAQIRLDRKAEIAERHDEKLSTRKLPPMSQMTRTQKRFFLEPWMTTLAIVAGFIACIGYVLAMFTPWHMEWAMFGVMFTVLAVIAGCTKVDLRASNERTEGAIAAARTERSRRDDW